MTNSLFMWGYMENSQISHYLSEAETLAYIFAEWVFIASITGSLMPLTLTSLGQTYYTFLGVRQLSDARHNFPTHANTKIADKT